MMRKMIPFSSLPLLTTALGFSLLGTLAFGVASASHAQAADEAVINKLPIWQPGHAVTTNIKDALPEVNYLRGYSLMEPKPIPDDWMIAPGYYRSVIRSYCLHAGTYGPTQGDGYLIAPLKGDRVPVIRNILVRSTQFPNIVQSDVQRLIWGVEDGAQWDSFEDAFKTRVAPLLTGPEITLLNLEPQRAAVANEVKKRFGGLIPGQAKKAVDSYSDLRNRITRTTSFAELEQFAVKTGAAPWGKDSRKDVKPGVWSYVGDGFFIRAFPSGYATTALEIYRVAPAKVTRDEKGRIKHFDSDGYIIDSTYADTPATETIGGKSTPVWRFSSVTFRHPDGRTLTVENKGYVVAKSDASDSFQVAALGNVPLHRQEDDGSLGSLKHYEDGLETVKDPSEIKDKFEWIKEHLNRVREAWDAANSALKGEDPKIEPKPVKFDPSKFTPTPANTAKQRLGLSAFKKKE